MPPLPPRTPIGPNGSPPERKLTAARTLLAASPHFVLERLTLPPESVWNLNATGEMWLFSLTAVETPDWAWFEEGLAYDNARLPQALIVTGSATGASNYLSAGLRALHWLMSLQTTPAGLFRPVGSKSFGAKRTRPLAFDQQPLEATASISACLAAWRAAGDVTWQAHAARAFAWFGGSNDLSLSLIDPETGSCR